MRGVRGSTVPCSIEGCDADAVGWGWCPKHYRRWRLYGDPLGSGKRGPKTSEQPWLLDRESGCWIWQRARTDHGRGVLWKDGKKWQAHVWTYTKLYGPVPKGFELAHTCHNGAAGCVNPHHVRPLTHAENVRETAAQRTHCPKGHPYDESNTQWFRGHRRCATCNQENARAWRERRALMCRPPRSPLA